MKRIRIFIKSSIVYLRIHIILIMKRQVMQKWWGMWTIWNRCGEYKKVRWSAIRKNTTHIKYIKVLDKLYKVTDISMSDMSIKAVECENDSLAAVEDVFLLEELQEFHITLYNKHEKSNITDFSEWKKQHNCQWNRHFFIVYMSLYIQG